MDMYLRILKAIDEEVVDRDVIRSQQVNFVNCFQTVMLQFPLEKKNSNREGYNQTEIDNLFNSI